VPIVGPVRVVREDFSEQVVRRRSAGYSQNRAKLRSQGVMHKVTFLSY
jgi:hypothetical protein